MLQERRIQRERAVRRTGSASAWAITFGAAAITAGLVVLFLRNLPAPPRFDELRIEPGSETRLARSISRRRWSASSEEPTIEVVREVAIESWPVDDREQPATRVTYQVPIEREATTFAQFAVDGASATVVIRRGVVVILEAGSESAFAEESASVVIPTGTSDLEIDVLPRGASPRLRVTWREVEVDDEPRSLATLMERRQG